MSNKNSSSLKHKKKLLLYTRMSQPFVYLPQQFAKASTFEVGTYAKEISNYIEWGIPVPKTVVIPHNTLKIIAQANNLQAKIYKLLQETNFSSSLSKTNAYKRIQHLITRQSIPKELASQLLKTYHEYFQESFILLKNAEKLPFADILVENIHSDTNFVDALLEAWARVSATKLEKLLLSTTNIHDILFPSPILVQEQFEPKISGIAYSFDQTDGSKNRITIKSSWGVYTPLQQDFDTYTVDVRTENIIAQQLTTKQTQYRRVIGKLREDEVLVKYQNQETLTQQQIQAITVLVSKIKRKYLSQVEIVWAIQDGMLCIVSVAEAELELPQYSRQQHTTQKIYATVSASYSGQKETTTAIDGIAVLNSAPLLFAAATHPNEVVKTKQKKYLVDSISKTLIKYIEKNKLPLIYKANSSTSAELSKLKFGSIYEVPEQNPLLGFRGGMRLISLPATFAIELESLQKVLEKTQQKITLVLPFVRSPEEVTRLIQTVHSFGLTQNPKFSLWFELATPENMLNIAEYPIHLVQGILCNLQSIHSLSVGVDQNNPDVALQYSQNHTLLEKLVEHAISGIAEKQKKQFTSPTCEISIDLTNGNNEMIERLCQLPITSFIVNQEVTSSVKTCIIDTQYKGLL